MDKETKDNKIEREYIIPLRHRWKIVPRYQKTNKAVKAVKEFIVRHMKIRDRDLDKVKLDKYLNETLWHRGIKNPPSRIKVAAVKEGDIVKIGTAAGTSVAPGTIKTLKELPEGTDIFNIESVPGDGGKFVRSSGTFGRVVAKLNNAVIIAMPSKKERVFNPNCLATVGIISGGGRPEKPFLKAGNKFHAMRKKNKFFPRAKGVSMNAVDHPFGGSRSLRKGRSTCAPHNAPPGRKVGMIRARRTGRKKGTGG
jgi:large subunit ribosomal protein L2